MSDVVEGEDEREFDGTGTFQPFSDSDTVTLFQDLEHELEKMVQRYHVPATELENLFQVVQSLLEMMDTSRDTYESLVEQKRELEGLWKTEKEKSKLAQQRRGELECRMEDEKSRLEREISGLQKERASLQTKLKQASEHKSYIEEELIQLKDKTMKDEQTRRDLLDTYKRQYDKARRSSLRRGGTLKSSHRWPPIAPHQWETRSLRLERAECTPDSIQSSEDSFPHSLTSGLGEGQLSSLSEVSSAAALPPPNTTSLEVELEREKEERENGELEDSLMVRALGESFEELPLGMQPPPPPLMPAVMPLSEGEETTDSEDEGAPIAPENSEGLSLEEELLGVAVSPELLTPIRAELDMLQKEKENWRAEKEHLERERREARSAREAFESECAQLQVECQQLQEKQQQMQEELTDVRKERNEVLEMYWDQPYDEYCITRKELLALLRRHHNTTIELEREKEEKQRLQRLLDAKKSFFERLKQSMRRIFNRYPAAHPSTSSSDRGRSYTPSDEQLLNTSHSDLSPPPAPASPLTRTIAHSLAVTTSRGWLSSRDSSVSFSDLPQWIGQIPLNGIEIKRVECAAVGRVFYSEETLWALFKPPYTHFNRRVSPAHHLAGGTQQLHAEVWVATTEESMSYIEIVDIVPRVAKVRQRFVVKPPTSHIVCMKAIPGNIEESSEFTDSVLFEAGTSWVADTFSPLQIERRSYSDTLPANKARGWRRGSTPDLLHSDPLHPSSRMAGYEETAFTQSLSILTPRESHTAVSSGVGGLAPGVARKLDFCPNGKSDRNNSSLDNKTVVGSAVSSPDPQSQSLTVPVWNHDTIVEGVDGTDTCWDEEGVWVVPDEGVGCGRGETKKRKRTSSVVKAAMWVITEDNRLVFYPTTDPSHISINSVGLPSRALCIEYIKGKVYIGHEQSVISIFHPDEFMQDTWDIQNPTKLSLPSSNATVCYDVKCIAAVGNNEIWVGVGPSIFFLDEQTLERRGSKFTDNWHHRPEKILPVGDLVLIATRASALYVFDRQQHEILRRFDITPIASLLESPSKDHPSSHDVFSAPTSIKSLAMDDKTVFVGTSSGHVVTIPIDKLPQKQSLPSPSDTPFLLHQQISPRERSKKSNSLSGDTPPRKPPRKGKRSRNTQAAEKSSPLVRVRSSESPHYRGSEENDVSEQDEVESVFLDQSAVSLHCHRGRVRTLLHVTLPKGRCDLTTQQTNSSTNGDRFNSMPNLSSAGYRLPLGQPLFKSLVVSIGKGHMEYSIQLPAPEQNVEDASARSEKNKPFQLMVWGHRNSVS